MNEKDIRLLFEAGHWNDVKIVPENNNNSGWKVCIKPTNKNHPEHILSSKRGSPRIFKTSDSALQWCKTIGFTDITVELDKTSEESVKLTRESNTILLVEDNADDVALTLRAFKKSHCNSDVVVVNDGKQALDFLFAKGDYEDRDPYEIPRLILLDIKLPKVNGLEVLKKIRDNEATRYIPVVLLTTSDENNDVVRGYKLGSNSYIRKPVDFDVFTDVVSDLTQYWLQINTPPPNHHVQ